MCGEPGTVKVQWPPEGWAAILRADGWAGESMTIWACDRHRRTSGWPYKVARKLDAEAEGKSDPTVDAEVAALLAAMQASAEADRQMTELAERLSPAAREVIGPRLTGGRGGTAYRPRSTGTRNP